jgi:hypothetical protein
MPDVLELFPDSINLGERRAGEGVRVALGFAVRGYRASCCWSRSRPPFPHRHLDRLRPQPAVEPALGEDHADHCALDPVVPAAVRLLRIAAICWTSSSLRDAVRCVETM